MSTVCKTNFLGSGLLKKWFIAKPDRFSYAENDIGVLSPSLNPTRETPVVSEARLVNSFT